jgi:hypothetical protein
MIKVGMGASAACLRAPSGRQAEIQPKLHLNTIRNTLGETQNMDFITDLWGFMRTRKKYWLLPIIITLLFFGILIVFTSGSAIAPFIYTIF